VPDPDNEAGELEVDCEECLEEDKETLGEEDEDEW